MQQQQQISCGAPGMAPPYPSPPYSAAPSNPFPNSPNPSPLNYPPQYHLSYSYSYPPSHDDQSKLQFSSNNAVEYSPPPKPPSQPQPQQQNYPLNSNANNATEYPPPTLPSYSSTASTDYTPSSTTEYSPQNYTLNTSDYAPQNYTSNTADYAPPPPLNYNVDPSYSPRAPSLPTYEHAPFDHTHAAAGAQQPWSPFDYQMNRSSSYGADTYGSGGGGYGGGRWSYEQQGEDFSASSFVESSKPDYSGVYAYDGGSSQPYGSRGTGSTRWTSESSNPLGDLPKLAKALPKIETESKGGGVQKYHVKLLQDSGSVGLPTNVVCHIGLDGVRLVDPGSGRNLRIYPLETITKWEVNEPTVFTFWAKSAVDFEQRRTRLQSGSSTTNAILDTLTAACVQLCEMVVREGDGSKNPTSSAAAEAQKRASFADWLKRPKQPAQQEEKEHWVPDEAVTKCTACASDFGPFLRRHHCRNCGDIFCDKCTRGRTPLTAEEDAQIVRVCDRCLAEVTHRLTNTKETSNKYVPQQSHEDLAKKLQMELERNAPRKTVIESESKSSAGQTSLLNCTKCGSISIVTGNSTRCPSCGSDSSGGKNGVTNKTSTKANEGSRRRTREVACPTCTVHLEVEVPNHGSETVECGVCQHPFLVRA